MELPFAYPDYMTFKVIDFNSRLTGHAFTHDYPVLSYVQNFNSIYTAK
jgi:hypothetical protein